MYLITNEIEAINIDLFADATGMNEEAIALAPVVALFTDTLPASAAAVNPFVAELVQANAAFYYAQPIVDTQRSVSPYKRKYDTAAKCPGTWVLPLS